MNKLISIFISCSAAALMTLPTQAEKLQGTPIGTSRGFNYESNSVVNNIQGRAFDSDLNTYFATDQRSYGWVGLDLGTPHVITRVGWAARNDGVGPRRLQCGIIQGANSDDFLDAVPLYIIPEYGKIGEISYSDVDCSKGFRYVRFVSTGDSRCNIAELEFYGNPGQGDDSRMMQLTNLPTVIINTVNSEEPYDKEHDITANIIIIDDNKIDTDAPGTIRERGNASRQFPKKPWRLKFDKKQSPLGAPAKAKKWTLLNNYGDKSLMRNLVAFDIANRLGFDFVPFGRAVDVILNGEYKGCYQLCDQVEVNKNRVNVTEMETTDITGDLLTGGYLIEVDGYADQEPADEWFSSQYGTPVTIKSPDDGGTAEQYNYIRNFFSNIESLAYSGKYDETTGYRSVFDIDSFIRYFLVQEMTGNTDGFWSTYFYKDRNDDRLHAGPVWDFDIAFDNDYRLYPTNNISGFISFSGRASAAGSFRSFAQRVINNDPQSVRDREQIWGKLRHTGKISSQALNGLIDNIGCELELSQELNFKRWPILNERVHMNPRVPGTYAQELEFLKDFLTKRIELLDGYLNFDNFMTSVDQPATDAHISFSVVDNRISTASDQQFSIYTIDGQHLWTGRKLTGVLPGGLYVVSCGTTIAKIAIR